MLTDILARLAARQDLSFDEMASVIDLVMRGDVSESQIGELLTSLRAKGETTSEIAGAAAAAPPTHDADSLAAHGVDRYLRHGRRRLSDLQHQHGRCACDRGGGCARGEAWQPRDVEPQRIGRCALRAGCECFGARACCRANAGDAGNLLLLRAAVARRDGSRECRAQAARRADGVQSARAAFESGRRAVSIARRFQA